MDGHGSEVELHSAIRRGCQQRVRENLPSVPHHACLLSRVNRRQCQQKCANGHRTASVVPNPARRTHARSRALLWVRTTPRSAAALHFAGAVSCIVVLRPPRILAWPIQAIEPRLSLWNSLRPRASGPAHPHGARHRPIRRTGASPTRTSQLPRRARAVTRPSQHSRSAPILASPPISTRHGLGAARPLAYATKRRPGYSPSLTQMAFAFAHQVRRTISVHN